MTLSGKTNQGIRELVDFVFVMLPRCDHPEKTVRWHAQNLCLVVDRDPHYHNIIQGVTLFRWLNEPDESHDRWVNFPGGKLFWVDWTVSLLKGGLARMVNTVYETLGRPEQVGFSRHKHNDRMSVYPVSFFDRLVKAGV